MVIIKIIGSIIYLLSIHFIAQYIGTKRKIGYGKSVFWSIVLSPLIGLVITLLSEKKNPESD